MKKKLAMLLTAAMLVGSLAACGSSDNGSSATGSASATDSTKTDAAATEVSGNTSGSSALLDSHFCLNAVLLLEVTLRNIKDTAGINIIFLEDRVDLLGK